MKYISQLPQQAWPMLHIVHDTHLILECHRVVVAHNVYLKDTTIAIPFWIKLKIKTKGNIANLNHRAGKND